MRATITSLSVAVSLALASAAVAQSSAKPASGKTAIRACALMTRDLVAKYDTQSPKIREMFKPEEEAIGTHGSSCNDGGFFVQIDPFVRSDDLRRSPAKDWQPVAGVGDTAFFHNNKNRWAELIVWTGSHHFTIQLNVPDGGTAESVKSNTTGMAAALIAKLKAY
jgi:hypothetical protein